MTTDDTLFPIQDSTAPDTVASLTARLTQAVAQWREKYEGADDPIGSIGDAWNASETIDCDTIERRARREVLTGERIDWPEYTAHALRIANIASQLKAALGREGLAQGVNKS